MENIQHMIRSGDQNLCVFEWPGHSPPILLVHATGFHARCWDQVIKHLKGRHVFAIDVTGHGRSDKPQIPANWKQYVQGIVDCILTLNLKDIVGVGHSMGGFLVTAAAAQLKDRFSALVLFDPVIMLPEKINIFKNIKPEEMFVSRRRNHFESPEEMFHLFEKKESYASWDPAVLKDYCNYGLLPSKEGTGYELACHPLIEAATYIASADGEWIYDLIKEIAIPVDVIRAREKKGDDGFSFSYSPTHPKLASLFQKGRDIHLKEMSHFFPMENPKLAAEFIDNSASRL